MSRGAGRRGEVSEERKALRNRLPTGTTQRPGVWAPIAPDTAPAGALARKETGLCPRGYIVTKKRDRPPGGPRGEVGMKPGHCAPWCWEYQTPSHGFLGRKATLAQNLGRVTFPGQSQVGLPPMPAARGEGEAPAGTEAV